MPSGPRLPVFRTCCLLGHVHKEVNFIYSLSKKCFRTNYLKIERSPGVVSTSKATKPTSIRNPFTIFATTYDCQMEKSTRNSQASSPTLGVSDDTSSGDHGRKIAIATMKPEFIQLHFCKISKNNWRHGAGSGIKTGHQLEQHTFYG